MKNLWKTYWIYFFSSVAQLCLTLCDPMNCSTPGFPVLHHLLELAQTHVHWVGDAIQPSGPLSITICNLKPSQKQSNPRELIYFSFFFFTVCDLIIKKLTCCPCKPWGPLGPTGPLKTNEKKSCIVFMTIVHNSQKCWIHFRIWKNESLTVKSDDTLLLYSPGIQLNSKRLKFE